MNAYLTISGSPTPTPFFTPGDVNNDGRVDTNDFKLVLANYALIPTSHLDQYKDSRINIFDSVVVIKNMNIISPSPNS